MPLFPSDEWLDTWVRISNANESFRASGKDWKGAVGVVLLEVPELPGGRTRTRYIRMTGEGGEWTQWVLNSNEETIKGTLFTLSGKYPRWKQVVHDGLNPLKAIVQGKLRVRGDLAEVLKWAKSILILTDLARTIDTIFIDDLEPGGQVK